VLYLFDGYNLLNAGGFRSPEDLVDRLASFVALQGARGVLVFDGEGADAEHGPLQVRYARPADHLLERLAAEWRERERVVLVSSDREIRQTAGQEVRKVASKEFADDLSARPETGDRGGRASKIEDALDPVTRERLERYRRRRP
jgi:predicted RNA-binding protein with PIN domain